MEPKGHQWSGFALKHMAEGRSKALIAVLEARGLAVSAEHRARIVACGDLAVLDRWIRRAVTAASVQEALD